LSNITLFKKNHQFNILISNTKIKYSLPSKINKPAPKDDAHQTHNDLMTSCIHEPKRYARKPLGIAGTVFFHKEGVPPVAAQQTVPKHKRQM